jgi:hypothetical protein
VSPEARQLYFGIVSDYRPDQAESHNLERVEKAALETGGLRTGKLVRVTTARWH